MKDMKLMKTKRSAMKRWVATGDHPFISFISFMVEKIHH
jgi:ribosomal protein L35